MTKGRNTSVKAEASSENVFNVVRTDGLEIGIMCALCHNHYRLALPDRAVLNCVGISWLGEAIHTQGRTRVIISHISSSQGSALGGRSGMKIKSAPELVKKRVQ